MSDHLERILEAFSYTDLKTVCELHETEFADLFGMTVHTCPRPKRYGQYAKWAYDEEEYEPFYAFKDNGSAILAVAHLDTVMPHWEREAHFADTAAGPIVHSGALDDRLGAYTILALLPNLGVNVDVLLTTGEESGRSTGQFFEPPGEYNWMIEFDRGGTDVVMYQYEDDETKDLVRACGAKVGVGIFSDISYMDDLEIKGFNWGVGYHDYHGPRSHAYLADYWEMQGYFIDFHEANSGIYLPHEERPVVNGASWHGSSVDDWSDQQWQEYLAKLDRRDQDWSDDFDEVNEACLREQERERSEA